MKNLFEKVDFVKVAGIAGTALSIAATLVGGWATQKSTDKTIEQKVAEALATKEK